MAYPQWQSWQAWSSVVLPSLRTRLGWRVDTLVLGWTRMCSPECLGRWAGHTWKAFLPFVGPPKPLC